MLFMLYVTPVVSSQMQLCSPLAIQILFDKEISADKANSKDAGASWYQLQVQVKYFSVDALLVFVW